MVNNYYIKNREEILAKRKSWYQANKELAKLYRLENKEYYKQKYNEWRLENPERMRELVRESARRQHKAYRDFLFDLLGRECKNCGLNDIRILHFDHINNDGYEDRKRLKGVNQFLRYYNRHPEEAKQKLQILCANCNWMKRSN